MLVLFLWHRRFDKRQYLMPCGWEWAPVFHTWKVFICIIMAEWNFHLYSQVLIVNTVLDSLRGFICNIFNHQVVCFKCHKQRDHGWDDWSSLSHTRFICAESTDSFSHNPPLSIFGVTEEDKHAGDFFISLPATVCHSFSSVCAEKQSNPGDFPPNPKRSAASGEAGGAASHPSSGPVVEPLHDECGYCLLMLKMIQVAPSKESAELSGHWWEKLNGW